MIQSGETLFDFHISNKQVNLTNWGWGWILELGKGYDGFGVEF